MKKTMKIAVQQVMIKPRNCFYCDIDNTNRLGDKDLPSSSLSDKWMISTDRAHIYNWNVCTTLHTNTWNIIQIYPLEFFFHIVSG